MKNIFGKKELFSIRKFSVGVASVIIGTSLLSVAPHISNMEVKAESKVQVEANKDVQIEVTEHDAGATINIVALKDISDAQVKVTLDGKKMLTYHISSLKTGEKLQKEISKEQLDRLKNSTVTNKKSLPNTSVVRKTLSKIFDISSGKLKVDVSYNVEDEDIQVTTKPEFKPEVEPTEPEVKPTEPEVKPTEPEVKPTEPEVKPTKPEVEPTKPEVEPTKPEVEPTKPEVEPTKPEVEPTKPEVEPTKPEVEPTEPEKKPEQPEVNPEDKDIQNLKNKLSELVKRELRTEPGYVANAGNQTANNKWIRVKTEAEETLKNEKVTKEQLEAAISNLESAIYNAVLGSEKTKVEKSIRSADRLDLIPKLRKAKTLEELEEIKNLLNKNGEEPAKPEQPTVPEKPEVKPENPKDDKKPEEKPAEHEKKPEQPTVTVKPIIENYVIDNKVISANGGEVNITIKGKDLTVDNVSVKVLNPKTATKDNVLSNSTTYKKVGNDVVATLRLPANNSSEAQSFNLSFTDGAGLKATTTYTEERGENGRVITILPTGKNVDDAVLSFVAISSYQAHHGTDLTTTTTDKGNVSKKTVAHLYGTNLKAGVTKVKIIDQNGVEWPIHTTGSNISASDYPMMLIGKLGNGISGNGTYQEAEIVLPNGLNKDMTFTYIFAPDGVNFDEKHKVTAIVETTSNVKSAEKRTITVKYQNENGEQLKEDKILTGYSWFDYNVEKENVPGYKNVIVKDNKALSGVFGDKDQEIVLVYTNKDIAPKPEEKPTPEAPQEETVDSLKAKLKELADRDLRKEDSYNKATTAVQAEWRRARAQANRALAESTDKDEIQSKITVLEEAINKIANTTPSKPIPEPKPEEKPTPEKPNKEGVKERLANLVSQDPTKEDNYKLAGSLPEKAWKRAKARAEMLIANGGTEEELQNQLEKLQKALATLIDENNEAIKKTDTPTSDVDEEVIINDNVLKKLINKNIDPTREDNQKITKSELEKLTRISLRDKNDKSILEGTSLKGTPDFKFIMTRGIKDISGLEKAINLEELILDENEIVDLSPLSNLNKLTHLSLLRNRISDVSPLSKLVNLEYLDLYSNKLTDISPLKNLVNLRHLDLHNNNDQTGDESHPTKSGGINNIDAVKNMTKLKLLSLGSNNIKDISVLKNLSSIRDLVLSGNHISDYSGLAEYIAKMLSDQLNGEGSVSFAGQSINYSKDIDVSSNSISIENPYKGINELGEKLAKVFESDEPINLFSNVETGIEGISGTYNMKTSKINLDFTDEFLNANKGKTIPVTLKLSADDYVWTIKGVRLNISEKDKVVNFADRNLKETLLKKLKEYAGKDIEEESIQGEYNLKIKDKNYRKNQSDTEIYEKDLEQLEAFAIRGYDDNYDDLIGEKQIKDLTGLEKAINLKQLTISGNSEDSSEAIRDITPLNKLKKLELLRLSHNAIQDISPLANLVNLKHLYISHNKIEDVSSLSHLNNLESFDIAKNKVSDISVVRNMPKLKVLVIRNNLITNITPIENEVELEWFDANANNISDILVIRNLKNLKNLYLDNNIIENTDAIESLSNTVELYLKNNRITNINLENLTNLEQLNLSDNKIKDITSIENLVSLKELYIANNDLSNINFSKLKKIDNLDISGNKIKDFSSLLELKDKQMDFDNQNIVSENEVLVRGDVVRIKNPFVNLADLVKNNELTITTDNNAVKANYDKNNNSFEFNFSKVVIEENDKLILNLLIHYHGNGYDDEEKILRLNNVIFKFEKEVFKDPVLNKKLSGKDLSKIVELDNLYGVHDLTGIEKLTNLTRLTINGEYNDVKDFSPLSKLTRLEELSLENTKVKDLSVLSNLTNLRILNIAGPFVDPEYSDAANPENYKINNIDALKNLTHLESLSLANRGVSDISPLANLTKLNDVVLSNNNISDISALKNLTELINLDLSSNKNIADITALKGLTNLTNLWLTENKITNIEALKDLINLKKLYINVNNISDLKPVATNLTKLTHLSLGANDITDVSPLSTLTNLVSLRAADNKISDVNALSTLTKLTDLNLSNNSIHDFSPLNTLEKINRKRGFGKQIEEVDVTAKEFTLPKAKTFDGSEIALDKNDNETLKVYEVVNKKGKNQPKVNDETEELVPLEKQYNIVEKEGKYVLPADIENGLYAVQWFKSYQEWGTFILNVNLQKETEKNSTDVVELSPAEKLVYRTLLNEWSNFNKNYKNLTDIANEMYVENKKPKAIPKPATESDFTIGDFEKLRVFDSNGELKIANRTVNVPVTNGLVKVLENAKNLEEFKVLAKKDGVRKITDFSFLDKLPNLKIFYYTNQNKTTESVDLSALKLNNNSELVDVRVGQGNLTSLDFIKGLKLKNLDAEDNKISDISAIKNMTTLAELHLDNNALTNDNISDIAGLTNLKTLYLKNNKNVSDINSLENLKDLEALELKHMDISDISVLKKLPNLRRLVIDGNPLATDYMDIIKTLNLNTGYLGEITKDDFEWLKTYAIREEVEATLNENKQREFTFTKLPITVEVKESQIIDGKVTIENPLKDWDDMGAGRDYEKDLPAELEMPEDDVTNITVDLGEETHKVLKYDINIEDYNHEFEGRPANIHGTVELTINVVDDTENPRR